MESHPDYALGVLVEFNDHFHREKIGTIAQINKHVDEDENEVIVYSIRVKLVWKGDTVDLDFITDPTGPCFTERVTADQIRLPTDLRLIIYNAQIRSRHIDKTP